MLYDGNLNNLVEDLRGKAERSFILIDPLRDRHPRWGIFRSEYNVMAPNVSPQMFDAAFVNMKGNGVEYDGFSSPLLAHIGGWKITIITKIDNGDGSPTIQYFNGETITPSDHFGLE